MPQAGIHRAVAWTICVGLTLFFPTQIGFCTLLWALKALLLSQLITPLVKMFFGYRNVSSPLAALPHRGTGPFLLPLFFPFLSFISPGYMRVFSYLFRCLRPLIMFSRCSLRIVPLVDVFLMPLCCGCSVSKLCPTLCDPMNCSTPHRASLPFSISWSFLKLMSIELVMPSNHLILLPFSQCVQLLVIPWTIAHEAPLPWNFSYKNTGVGLFPPPGDLLDPGVGPSLVTPALASGFFTTAPPGKP